MARELNRLSARAVATLTEPGRYADGGGLHLVIAPGGSRKWVFRYTIGGKTHDLGLGSAREVSLAEARQAATKRREEIRNGQNPIKEKAKQAAPLFGAFALDYVETMQSQWRNEKHIAQWKMTLTKYAAPLHAMPLDAIGTDDVLAVLKPLWSRTPETAERLRGRIEAVLDAAKAKGWRSGENPAQWRGHLEQLLPRRQRLTRGHHKAMPYGDLAGFLADLRTRDALAARALEFIILTAGRSGEALNATWAEIDLAKSVWTVPAIRMKAGREHRVPLTTAALAVLERVKLLSANGEGFLFPGERQGRKGKVDEGQEVESRLRTDAPLSSTSIVNLMARMGCDATIHGFRSSFRDWAAETTGFPHEVCEMALAHTIPNKAEAAYRRGDLFDKRRALMEAWAAFCEPKPANVVAMKRGA